MGFYALYRIPSDFMDVHKLIGFSLAMFCADFIQVFKKDQRENAMNELRDDVERSLLKLNLHYETKSSKLVLSPTQLDWLELWRLDTFRNLNGNGANTRRNENDISIDASDSESLLSSKNFQESI